jgi:hypothetical protein
MPASPYSSSNIQSFTSVGGTTIADILGICRYFEELYPNPPLMGRTAEDKGVGGVVAAPD